MKKSQLQQLIREVLQEQALKPVLKEGAISLTPDEIKQVEDIIPKVINAIKQNKVGSTVGTLKYVMADKDKSPASAKVYIYDKDNNSAAHFDKKDKMNLHDNLIGVNYNYYGRKVFNKFSLKIWYKLTGNSPIDDLRSSITHELIHAKDPATNHHYLKEPYDPRDEKLYYGSWTEFPTMTGQFFEIIKLTTKEYVKKNSTGYSGNYIITQDGFDKLMFVYDDLLNTFAGKKQYFDNLTYDWFSFIGDSRKNSLQKFIEKQLFDFGWWVERASKDTLWTFLYFLQKVKKYNPEGYKEFLKDLYVLIDGLKDKYKGEIAKRQKKTNTSQKPKFPTRSGNPDWFQVKTPR